jgi:hypothetical protein
MRRVPSRRMPPRRELYSDGPDGNAVSLVLCVLFVGGLLYWGWHQPLGVLALLGLIAVVVISVLVQTRFDNRRQRRLAANRAGESLCTFARSFHYRKIDTWIIRAVYEQIQAEVQFPIRPSDRFVQELSIDPDDLGEFARLIAARAGRTLDGMEQNPWYFQVQSVDNLVMFFHEQPKTTEADMGV